MLFYRIQRTILDETPASSLIQDLSGHTAHPHSSLAFFPLVSPIALPGPCLTTFPHIFATPFYLPRSAPLHTPPTHIYLTHSHTCHPCDLHYHIPTIPTAVTLPSHHTWATFVLYYTLHTHLGSALLCPACITFTLHTHVGSSF